jgi:hypothetical protein
VTAVAVVPGSRAAAPEQLQWLSPAPLWNEGSVGLASSGLTQPWIAELTSDQFVPEFLGILAGTQRSTQDNLDLANTVPAKTLDNAPGGPYKLFQPLAQCYYLVAASLVCKRPGIPDHAVRPAKGERTTFVLRQVAPDGTENAWVPRTVSAASGAVPPGQPITGSWVTATANALIDNEEQLPMHAAPVAAFAAEGSTAATLGMADGGGSTRTVYYGYVPVGRRERMIPAIADADVMSKLSAINTPTVISDPIADSLLTRVIAPWQALRVAPDPSGITSPGGPQAYLPTYGSLYVILDLADWLSTYIPSLYQGICNNTGMPDGSARKTLQDQMGALKVPAPDLSTTVSLTEAIADLKPFAPLVQGVAMDGPTTKYNLLGLTFPSGTVPDIFPASPQNWINSFTDPLSLYKLAIAARAEEATPVQPTVPPELSGLIKDDPAYVSPGTPQTTYVIRTVLTHAPCQPLLSAPSHPFVLARATDGEAPARKIRIQLPDVANLRQFNRGVALEMPPSLNALVNRITPDILKGSGLANGGGIGLGMICSFSIQIIFICAFIILFIFLLLLNIVFFWMPFLKICLPIPVKTSSPPGPTP